MIENCDSLQTPCHLGPWPWQLTVALRTCNFTVALRLGLGPALVPPCGATENLNLTLSSKSL
jgi:hypothetical protein